MITRINIIIIFLLLCSMICLPGVYSQPGKKITFSGKVFNSVTKRPVDFARIVVMEAGVKTYSDNSGNFIVTVSKPGMYTVIVQSEQLQLVKTRVDLNKSMKRNFYLQPLRIKGATLTVIGRRDIQKISRYTMTRKKLKEVPGSFGDSINALTSMPGVIRTNGFFGPLVIRGANPSQNSYLIDEIPIYNPMHFGGVHSVINNNLMSEVDLYASSFPVQFGSANAAIISINTVDDVKEFGGYTDIGLISASALVQAPILRNKKTGDVEFASPVYSPQKETYDNAGYAIVSGRVGYISLFVPVIYRITTGEKLTSVPQYWDYQAKFKYYFAKKHAVTLLLMGSTDYWKVIEEDFVRESDDPLLKGFKAKVDWSSHSQGLFYTYEPSDKFFNRITLFSALIKYYSYFSLTATGAASWLQDLHVDSRPYIFGGKERFTFTPNKKHLQFKGGMDYSFYYFTATGKTALANTQTQSVDVGDESLATAVSLDERILNHTLGGFFESKLSAWGLSLVPGIRADYLKRSDTVIYDPRGRISYEFPTETTISVAGGRYSYFFQINPFLFTFNPQVCKIGKELKPERAIHRAVALEQKKGQYTFKMEFFYNNFYDMAVEYYHYDENGNPLDGMSVGKVKTGGYEIMLKKDLKENEAGLFGWINYTFTRSKYKSGLPTEPGIYGDPRNVLAGDPYGNQWINFEYEMRHSMKLVSGYKFRSGYFRGMHTLSSRFQYYSSLPYTPIVNSYPDTDYAANNPGKERHLPLYGHPNSNHFENQHQLDIRYSYQVNYSWGYVSWYIEVINCYGHWYRPTEEQDWDYRSPYSDSNPELKGQEGGLKWLPNFGVEVKF